MPAAPPPLSLFFFFFFFFFFFSLSLFFLKKKCSQGDHTDTHAVSTSLVIRKNFILTGDKNYVEFQYRVSAELCHSQFYSCDGLSFFVDNDRVFPDPSETFDRVAQQLNWAHFKHQVSMGMHTLKWTFQKVGPAFSFFLFFF